MTITAHTSEFSHAVEAAIGRLATVRHGYAHSTIVMPVLYPSGGTVVLEVRHENGKIRVSDNASAYFQATSYGVSAHSFARTASAVLESSHVKIQDSAIYVSGVSFDALPTALVVVADFAREIVMRCVAALDETASKARADYLIDRLQRVFSPANVSRDVTLRGASSHAWHITGHVRISDSFALFEPVSAHHGSVASVATKFHDFRSLSNPPPRVSVVPSKKAIGDLYGVLAQASRVVERDDADNRYAELARVH